MFFTYDKTIGKHDINAVAGFSAEQWDYEIEAATGIGYTFRFGKNTFWRNNYC
jgi:hypothetical protein